MPFEWSLDYCLSCDREAPNGAAYCSQACRLADMERASCSSSPKTATSTSTSGAPGGFYLPPALNFSTLSRTHETTSGSPVRSNPTWLPPSNSNGRKGSAGSNLHPSPSRTSLSSMPSQHSPFEQSYLSEKALRELNDYANAFDQVRDNKRRMTIY
ncbi:hypothetical protein TWF225_000879 [Orbilia oligospora]|uniref:Uncharacterized protein n=1 Tax=Orbilia oligospora TaxID=2813651 RepID=A0A4Z0X4L9_ORBOL|nr:hypothetical protein TWF102_004643 [Orbilia oligospora]KAF3081201.1 hypothetical protein TWF103_003900 [Orbilia oligospora]KAF3088994.1 hypothetical protein TWF706_010550 [Orbilia oligospora]KAF3123889.1 hypothetical protein TWF703_000599 [Orbilia oligospora]KAF3166041.1 hypothetical protein TWF225_000879 [Orbilia oligospora]